MKNYSKKIFLFVLAFFTVSAFAQKRDALELYRTGNLREAIRVCEDELVANPNNMNSYCVLCWSLIENRQYAEAEKRASEARKKETADYRITQVLGEAKYNLNKYDEALSLFQRYISKAPDSHDRVGRTYFYMGEIYIKQAKFQHADIALSTAVKKDGQKDLWWQQLGYCREQLGDWKNALLAYDQSLALNSSQRDSRAGRDRCLKHVKQINEKNRTF